MANRRHRRKFTEAFKAETVRLLRESGKTVAAVAREMDLLVARIPEPHHVRAAGGPGPLTSVSTKPGQVQSRIAPNALTPKVFWATLGWWNRRFPPPPLTGGGPY